MTRSITIWHVYNDVDLSLSDRFFTTKTEAIAYASEQYGVSRRQLSLSGSGQGLCGTTYLTSETIILTKEGIVSALNTLPIR